VFIQASKNYLHYRGKWLYTLESTPSTTPSLSYSGFSYCDTNSDFFRDPVLF